MRPLNQLHQQTSRLCLYRLAAWLALAFSSPTMSMPTAPTIVSGNVTMSRIGDLMTIRNSTGAVINWGSFSIGSQETVIFNQASAASRVFNRVTGNSPSEILGHMQSNGTVFLINPAGIYFGINAKIDVAGLVASTLNMTDADFLSGRMRFIGESATGKMANDGLIVTPTGGKVFLLGPQVDNHGEIRAPSGTVQLTAARAVEFADTSMPGVTVSLETDNNTLINTGKILAESGKIGLLGAVVKQQGTVSTQSLVREGGKIFIRATQTAELGSSSSTSSAGTKGGLVSIDAGETTLVSGTVDVRGSTTVGGQIQILGDNVGLLSGANLNASGQRGGGSILIGGDYQGGNPNIHNAQYTYFDASASIHADALKQGSGGKIILWADDSTRAFGQLSARGGSQGGNGGFVEASGKQGLLYQARADLRAPLGKAGLLLLDPGDITINPGDGSPGGTMSGGSIFSALGPASSLLDWDDIAAQMVLGNVQILAKNTGSINLLAGNYNTNATTKLSLLAEGSISFSSGNMSLGGSLEAYAGWDGTSSTPNLLGLAGQNISLYSSHLQAKSITLGATGNISDTTTAGPLSRLDAENLIAKSTGGNIYLPGDNLSRYISLTTTSGDIDYVSKAAIATVDASTPSGDITIQAPAGDIGLKLLTTTGAVTVDASGRIFDDNGHYTTNIDASTISLTSGGSNSPSFIAISADVVTPSISASVGSTGGYGGIDIRQNDSTVVPSSVTLSDISPTAGYGNIRYSSRGDINLDSVYNISALNGRVSVQSDGNITANAPSLTVGTGAIDIHASGNLTVQGAGLTTTTSSLQLGASGDVTISAPVSVTGVLAAGVTKGDLSISSGSSLVVDAALSAPQGNVALQGSSIAITTNGGTAGPGDALNITMNANTIAVEGSVQAQYNVNLNSTGDTTVANGGMLSANGNINMVTGGKFILDSGSIVADNEISMQLSSTTGEIQLNNGSSIAANQSGGIGLIKIAFLGRSFGGILSDTVDVVFSPGISNGFTNNGKVATPGLGMELTYAGGFNAVSNDLYGTFGDGSTACHYRGGPCGGSYSPTAYANVSTEDSFKLFRDETSGTTGQFGGTESMSVRPRSGKAGTCNR